MTHNVFWLAVRVNGDETRKNDVIITSGFIEFWKGEMRSRYKTSTLNNIKTWYKFLFFRNVLMKVDAVTILQGIS